jgi:hypothetical protein
VKLDEKFMSVVIKDYDAQSGAEDMLPDVLARACVTVLGVAGAGLSITDELRVPLAASDDLVARAERLQTTLGEGPCLSATAEREPLIADQDLMATRWPIFHRELHAQTPFRSIASLPLNSVDHQRLGALDLYSTEPHFMHPRGVAEISANVANAIAAILFDTANAPFQRGAVSSAWLVKPPAATRMNVWVAVGILIEHATLSNADALAALRAYAFSHDMTLEDVATEMSTRRLDPATLLDA